MNHPQNMTDEELEREQKSIWTSIKRPEVCGTCRQFLDESLKRVEEEIVERLGIENAKCKLNNKEKTSPSEKAKCILKTVDLKTLRRHLKWKNDSGQ